MHLTHLNCGTMHPYGLPAQDGTGSPTRRGHGLINCLLVETGAGLVLVDTGWGTQDYAHPTPPVRRFLDFVACPRDPAETAFHQVKALGYTPADVRHIILTHLHMDHAGGLPDFPQVTVHLLYHELEAFTHPRSLTERYAYRPEHAAHQPHWQVHSLQGDRWFGLDATPPIHIGEAEFCLVPLTGHTRGHCAIALHNGSGWLLHCGDAYSYHHQVSPSQPYRHPNGRLVEALVTLGFRIPRRHWHRLHTLLRAHPGQVQTFCAHDSHEFEACR